MWVPTLEQFEVLLRSALAASDEVAMNTVYPIGDPAEAQDEVERDRCIAAVLEAYRSALASHP